MNILINYPHLTAIRRKALSAPVRWLKEHYLLCGRILDFGCGYGFDTDKLKQMGYNVQGYDNYYRPTHPEGKFDTIICIYVLNVLEELDRAEVLETVKYYLKDGGKAYFAVRRDLKKEGFRYHPIQKKYTFQCNVILSYHSLFANSCFELYMFQS